MFGLAQQIGGDPCGIARAIGDDQNFRRASHHINADNAIQLTLGLCDPGIAGASDDIHAANALCAKGKGGNGLRPANPPDFIHAGQMRRREHQRVNLSLGRRGDHHKPLNTRDARRNGVHQHGGGIGRPPAGHIDTSGINRPPARTQPHARCIGHVAVGGLLLCMIGANTLCGEIKGGAQTSVERGIGGRTVVKADLPIQIMSIKSARVIGDGRITFLLHPRDNGRNIARHIGIGFTPGIDQLFKTGRKISRAGIQPKHGPLLESHPPAHRRRRWF